MEAKDASDDEKNSVGGKSPKLEIVDAVENDGHSSPEEKEITESVKPKVKKKVERRKQLVLNEKPFDQKQQIRVLGCEKDLLKQV